MHFACNQIQSLKSGAPCCPSKLFQVIATDFARLEAETKAAETAGKKEFDEFMEDSKAGLGV